MDRCAINNYLPLLVVILRMEFPKLKDKASCNIRL